MSPGPRERHAGRRDRHGAAREENEALARRLVRGRLAAFLAALLLGLGGEWTAGPLRTGLLLAAVAAGVAFVWLVRRHRRVRERVRWHRTLEELADEGMARLDRSWSDLPPAPAPEADRDHPYAADLDVLGPASLGRLLATPATPPGSETLRSWLLSPAGTREVERRQAAVAALEDEHGFREELTARGRLAGEPDARAFDAFLRWAEAPAWLPDRRWLVWTARLLPAATAALALAHASGLVGRAWWALGPAVMLGVAGAAGPGLGREVERATVGETELERYAEVLAALAGVEGDAAELERIRRALGGGGGEGDTAVGEPATAPPAAEAVRRLGRRAAWAEVRRNGLVHFVLQALFLWDVHLLESLERWKARHGHRVGAWLEALGRGEALSALATLRADHPDWCFPELVREGEPALEAEALGHPLLRPDECVRNDLEVGPPGTFLLVTGSNMSGKSTLLRAAGLAVVLARAGGPVPARRCSTSPLRVQTVIRVDDSVTRGVSQYMAELERTRRVVAAARGETGDRTRAPEREEGESADGAASEPVLYLLDEPLQGTNEAERRVALRTVLRHLLRTDAVGAVATHDLRLHEVDDLEAAARPVHFTGTVEEGPDGPRLRFDYRLREGPATSTNALDLLRAVGLGEDGPPGG